jgi:hypothetical protein
MAFYSLNDLDWIQEGIWSWALKFAWLPIKLDSGSHIWFKKYYHGARMITGPGTPVYLHQFLSPEEFTWMMLVQNA